MYYPAPQNVTHIFEQYSNTAFSYDLLDDYRNTLKIPIACLSAAMMEKF